MRILLAEDDPQLGRATQIGLEQGGYAVDWVTSAEHALRYTPAPGCVVISCGVEKGRSYLRVADTGPGIAEQLHERMFERFVRLVGVDCGQLPGSGLGLSIVRRIAERHGADIVLGAGLQERGLAVTVVFP